MQPGQKKVKSVIKKKDYTNTVFCDPCKIPVMKIVYQKISRRYKTIPPSAFFYPALVNSPEQSNIMV